MKLNGVVWLRNVVDKLAWKHNITINEVEEALKAATRFRFIEKGDVEGEPLWRTTLRRGGPDRSWTLSSRFFRPQNFG